jgi:hypothetical protein
MSVGVGAGGYQRQGQQAKARRHQIVPQQCGQSQEKGQDQERRPWARVQQATARKAKRGQIAPRECDRDQERKDQERAGARR